MVSKEWDGHLIYRINSFHFRTILVLNKACLTGCRTDTPSSSDSLWILIQVFKWFGLTPNKIKNHLDFYCSILQLKYTVCRKSSIESIVFLSLHQLERRPNTFYDTIDHGKPGRGAEWILPSLEHACLARPRQSVSVTGTQTGNECSPQRQQQTQQDSLVEGTKAQGRGWEVGSRGAQRNGVGGRYRKKIPPVLEPSRHVI